MISVADPRRSTSSLVMNLIIMRSLKWATGWRTLTAIAGNVRSFTNSSSAPIKAVVSGDVAAATTIDFYAASKIARLGPDNLGFILPAEKTVFNSDPIAVLKGAPNSVAAERFVKFVISPTSQRLLILKKGTKGGPVQGILGRMAVNPLAYDVSPSLVISPNPFKLTSNAFKIDMALMTKQKTIISDLVGAFHCDTHALLQKAWHIASNKGPQSKEYRELVKPPFPESELPHLEKIWDNPIERNKIINKWTHMAKNRYQRILSMSNG